MHLLMLITAVTIAYTLRYSAYIPQGNWHLRWSRTLFFFLFPPLLILMTVMAVVCMGTQGQMVGIYTDYFSYVLGWLFLGFLVFVALKLAWQGWQSLKSARECPTINLTGQSARLLPTSALFAGQIGFWSPELVVSQGLLKHLSPEQLESVLAHEQGHYSYRDTFCFFWLGWIRSCSACLPNTEPLWQELLMLRELRADSYAAARVDPLVLAESLLLVVSSQPLAWDIFCAALSSSKVDRLEQRIDALLSPLEPNWPEWDLKSKLHYWRVFALALLPLVTVFFHS
ncbi:M48 family metalloprotease [Cylindrospermopsis raciborskii CHAB3438]|uniref:M56 family metallopeptidase n=1 Tax=Cylindrospermopsis raciborskii TaxID=77022 RepID=UPI001F0D6F84|nr:M56 family metallopeptidase [Cylindrospermopsis raciborskii]MCH4902859.1 M48 family metalloprotease [Cylindrospermopsis raciborskii CHAB3438]MEB3147301.1 M56 family metallopeptidase [Cylindrospermopsis raciborskii]